MCQGFNPIQGGGDGGGGVIVGYTEMIVHVGYRFLSKNLAFPC